MTDLIEDVVRRTGIDPAAAAGAVKSVVEVLASGLEQSGRDDLVALLPDGIGKRLRLELARGASGGEDELYRRTGESLGLRPTEALETAQVVCQAIYARLDGEARVRMARQLEPALLRLLSEPPSAVAPAVEPGRQHWGAGHTLATGRPGSMHPVSESHAQSGHRESIARADNPHGEHKLSSGTPGPDEEPTLARGEPGSGRPLSRAKPED